jgi:hypothetical protein
MKWRRRPSHGSGRQYGSAKPDVSTVFERLRHFLQTQDLRVELRAFLQVAHVQRDVIELRSAIWDSGLEKEQRTRKKSRKQQDKGLSHLFHFEQFLSPSTTAQRAVGHHEIAHREHLQSLQKV